MAEANILGLSGKGALVVGGASGIGRATCLLLARAGAKVTVADLDAAAAAKVASEVASLGAKSGTATGDATVERDAAAIVDTAIRLHGALEVVVNIVGMAGWVRLLELDDAAWDLDFQRNLRHHLYVGRAAARRMIEQGSGGRMAFVASVSGLYGAPNHGAYGAAKAGVMALARTMAVEWGEHGIRVNSVAPDMIDTPRVVASRQRRGELDSPDFFRENRLSVQRRGVPEDIAGALVFLVSDLSGFITGQNIIVDGGRWVKPSADAPSM